MTRDTRLALVWLLLTAVGPGMLFAPVFGVPALLAPLGVVAVGVFACAELARRWPGTQPWRPVLALGVGLVGLTELLLFDTTAAGLPTAETLRALGAGVTDSWQLTLQSTWPARADPELLLFVPLAALVAAVLAVELLERLRRPLVAVLPGLALVVVSQAYVALTGPLALAVGGGFAAACAGVLVAAAHRPPGERRVAVTALMVVPVLVFVAAGATLGAAVDPVDREPYSLRDNRSAPVPPQRVNSPLDEVADRLLRPDGLVFRYTADHTVDRWRVAALDRFNGTTWKPSTEYRRMGAELPPSPEVTAPVDERRARVLMADPDPPWVPSQTLPASVTGAAPLVGEDAGMLLLPDRAGPVDYELTWWEQRVDRDTLYGAGIDPDAASGFGDLGVIPPGVAELARSAVHRQRPSFRTALMLERFFQDNYEVATGTDLPTGNGWPQLRRFLLDTKRGTSEQFAAAYVALARIIGLPARVAVGYRVPDAPKSGPVDVRNEHVLAWPEVAVAGIGWVPLHPMAGASRSGSSAGGLAGVTARARASLPPPEQLVDPELPDQPADTEQSATGTGISLPLTQILVGIAVLVLAGVVAVPLARAVRHRIRRRLPGVRGVLGAWAEVRDRLRAHQVPYSAGMTVRDLAAATDDVVDRPGFAGLHELARTVDVTLWSAAGPQEGTTAAAWGAADDVRRALAARPLGARLRAALNVRCLFPPRR